MIRQILLAFSLASVLAFGSSCTSSDSHGDDYHGHDHDYDHHDQGYYGGGGGTYGGGGYYGGGAGGGYDRPAGIPHGAVRVAEDGGKVYWTADGPGVVYIYSNDDRTVPWSGPIRRGDQLVVVPNSDDIVINDHVVWHGNLKHDSRHQVFFDRGGGDGGNNWGGGAHNQPNGIPHDALRVAEDGGKVYWTADGNGRVWVYSAEDGVVPWSGPIHRGDKMVVVPNSDDIVVNDHVVWHGNLKRDGRHQIFFAREGGGGGNSGAYGGGGGGGAAGVPGGSAVLARGRGNISIDQVPRDGSVYVYDDDDHKVLYRCDINRGNSFQIFPGKNYVNLNSKRAAEVRMADDHHYTLYFQNR